MAAEKRDTYFDVSHTKPFGGKSHEYPEEIACYIESGKILGVEENSVHANQKIYILEIENYAVIVPFVETEDEIFLKTAFPSRKYTKRYGLKGE